MRCTAASSTSAPRTRPRRPPLEPAELPELNNGPHFFYGLQWWFFGVLAIFGFFYLAYDEWRKRPGGSKHQRKPAEADQDANASA